jgi:signal transduction histidine kinase
VAFAVTIAVLAGVVALSTLAYVTTLNRLQVRLDESVRDEVAAFDAGLEELSAAHDDFTAAARAYLSARTGPGGAVLVVRTSTGALLSNSDVRLEDDADNAAVLQGEGELRGFTDVTTGGEAYRAAHAQAVGDDGEVLGVFQAALPVEPTHRTAREVAWTLLASGMLVVAVVAVLSLGVARASLRPLTTVARSAERIGRRSLDHRVPYEGPADEVGAMVQALNSMLDRVEHLVAEHKRFVSDASHELRTPLTVLSGQLELAADDRLDAADHRASIHEARDEVVRMRRLVDDLLTLARLEQEDAPRMQPLDVATLVWEAVERTRALGPVEVVVDVRGAPWIQGDQDRLGRALLNLGANAVRFVPANGRVCLGAERTGRIVSLWVEDTGPGIAEEDLARVFDRFFRGRQARAGSEGGGLGLAIVKRVIEQHGGAVRAEHAAGGGARIVIELPALEPPPSDASSEA